MTLDFATSFAKSKQVGPAKLAVVSPYLSYCNRPDAEAPRILAARGGASGVDGRWLPGQGGRCCYSGDGHHVTPEDVPQTVRSWSGGSGIQRYPVRSKYSPFLRVLSPVENRRYRGNVPEQV